MSYMEITTRIGCRNNCIYCPQDKIIKAYRKKSNNTIMTLEMFKRCIDKMPLHIDIVFSGMCEPWLNPECTNMLLYAYNKGHEIMVYTTLVGISLSNIESLESVFIKKFDVHLPSEGTLESIKVNEDYLQVLNKILSSKLKASYHYRGERLHPQLKCLLKDKNLNSSGFTDRVGNLGEKYKKFKKRKTGPINCIRNLRTNMLLPNGDVILCCMDEGMQHKLGNLIKSDYGSLFKSEEFYKIEKGLKDDSIDIACRYCPWFAIKRNKFMIACDYVMNRAGVLREIHNIKDFYWFKNLVIGRVRKYLHIKR